MKRLPTLDFLAGAPRPWGGVAAAAVGAAFVAGVGLSCWQIELDNRQRAIELAAQTARRLPPPPRKLSESERVRLAQTANVAGELRAPWGDLLSTFENRGRGDIGLLKLEPDAKAGVVKVTGQARNTKALFAYLRALEDDARLERVALTTQQLERDTPGQPVRFTIQAQWRTERTVAKEQS
jgi:Tfp pilus assembly protein PilN